MKTLTKAFGFPVKDIVIEPPSNMMDAPITGYFTACRRVNVKCPNPKCGGGIADRGAYRVAGQPGYVACTKCRCCGHIFNAGRPQSEGAL